MFRKVNKFSLLNFISLHVTNKHFLISCSYILCFSVQLELNQNVLIQTCPSAAMAAGIDAREVWRGGLRGGPGQPINGPGCLTWANRSIFHPQLQVCLCY